MSSSSAFIQDDNPPTSSQENDSKKIDIFQHLRINLKTSKTTCSCDNINSLYCIPETNTMLYINFISIN